MILAISAYLFSQDLLTVSETFPLELRSQAIALIFGTAAERKSLETITAPLSLATKT